jgi:hypothetical protein
MTEQEIGTHVTHCCIRHGCKYGDGDCPVAGNRSHVQEYLCEFCGNTDDLYDEDTHPGLPHYTITLVAERSDGNEVAGLRWMPLDEELLHDIKELLENREFGSYKIKAVKE